MKPSFALVLTQDTIGLLHRTPQGWNAVGEAAVTDPELTAALDRLRRAALDLEPGGITSKLVIPNSEILYTRIAAAGPSASARRAQIRAALEGRTPYAVADLVFDWRGSGPEVQVAVVARETLHEAEAFAGEHGFGPLSFVASPEPGTFDGEPWFGTSQAAPGLLPEGAKVERDAAPVPVARPRRQSPEAVVPEEPSPPPAEPPAPAAAPPVPVPPEAAPVASVVAPEADLPVEAPAVPVAAEVPAAVAAQVEEVATTPPAAPPQPEPLAEPPAPPAPPPFAPATVEAPAAEPLPPLAASAPPRPPVLDDPLPPPLGRAPRADVIAQSLDLPPDDPAGEPPARTGGVPAPAVERLKARLAEQPADARRFGARAPGSGAAPPPLGPAAPAPARSAEATPLRPLKPVTPAASRAASPAARPTASGVRAAAKGAARGAAAMVTSPSIPIPRERRVNIPVPEAGAETRSRGAADARKTGPAEGDGLTAFGGRQVRRGKPRYLGLILTGILLVLLAGVAAWSSFLSSDSAPEAPAAVGEASPAPAPAAAGPSPADTAAAGAPLPEPEAEPTASLPLETAEPGPVTATAEPAVLPEADPAPAPDTAVAAAPEAQPGPAASAEPAPQATLATSGSPADGTTDPGAAGAATAADPSATAVEAAVVAQPDATDRVGRNPATEAQDEIFLAMTDPAVPIADLVTLAPPVAATDSAPDQQPLPPPFGTVYQFDANGMIVPTPEGVVTPDGVRLVLGAPPRVPPARPEALAPVPAETEAAALTTDAAAGTAAAASVAGISADPGAAATDAAAADVAEGTPPPDPATAEPAFASDPALEGARPRSRPANLVPAGDDDAALPLPAETQLTSLRPRERPAALLAAAEAAQATERPAAEQAAAASLAAADTAETAGSPLAIAVSRRPAVRPQDFSRAVEAAVAAASQQPPAVAPDPAPEETVVASAPAPKPKATGGAIAAPEEPAPAAKPKKEPEPAEIDEPEVASEAPNVPTRANVAKQATFRNAINLSKVNLIGVYGSASNRYALVRQPNGRYVKVSVGDRVDGGRVAAISERELRYEKNGRTVTLSMPKS